MSFLEKFRLQKKKKKKEGNDEFEQKASRNQRLNEYPWLAHKKGRRIRRICVKEQGKGTIKFGLVAEARSY